MSHSNPKFPNISEQELWRGATTAEYVYLVQQETLY